MALASDPHMQSTTTAIRADGLYFQDCGLVIQAENVVFRVSSDFLAVQSPIFRDMLSIPAPADAERYDGCLIVHLPDSAEDISTLLKALIYHDFFEPVPADTTFSILSAVLRMSDKYDVATLRRRAIAHLDAAHPTILAGFDALPKPQAAFLRPSDMNNQAYVHVEIAILARRLSLDWILPMAFYRICRLKSARAVLLSSLDLEDKLRVIESGRSFLSEERNKILDCFWSRPSGCLAGDRSCHDKQLAVRKDTEIRFMQFHNGNRLLPLDFFGNTPMQSWTNAQLPVCAHCLAEVKRLHEMARQSFWDSLPGFFGLPGWVELEKTKAASLE
ncbi:hypothetical protein C8F01DRAFT_1062289 [Mycena amicta]|nr:hypothetical protein C8F01DRAFT_1062289 [Mycena amicta]